MATDEKKSIIHRKAMGGRDEFDARVMSPSKALRLALAKVSDKMYGMAVTVTMVQQVKLANKDVKAEAGEDGLLLLLDGEGGARGAAKVDGQFLTALIEMQTTGKVRRAEADARPVTRTDAAIVAPLLDAVFARYDEQLAEGNPAFVKENYRFGDMIEDARSLALALEAPDFDLYRLTLDLEDGAKTGQLTLMLPHREQAPKPEAPGKPRHSARAETLERNALDAQVALDAVLTRLKLPLKDVCAFTPGMVLPVEASSLKKTQLTAVDGKVIARVRMGQMNGMRAVLFVSPLDDDAETEAESKAALLGKASEVEAKGSTPAPKSDDVVEGTAQAVPAETAPTPAKPEQTPAPSAEEASTDPFEDAAGEGEELSAEDLMNAAKSLSASVRDEHESA